MVLAQLRLSWSILGVAPDGVAPAATRSSPWRWIALLAASLGLILLTGEPRAMAEAEIVATFLVVWLTLRRYPVPVSWQRRVRYRRRLDRSPRAGAARSARPSCCRVSPSSPRRRAATTSYAFFGSGSLHPQWSVLLLVPDLFGGNGILGQPQFFNSYNLPEVTGYLGLVPAGCRRSRSVPSLFGRRRDHRASDYLPWFVLGGDRAAAVVGVLHDLRPGRLPYPLLLVDAPPKPVPRHRRPRTRRARSGSGSSARSAANDRGRRPARPTRAGSPRRPSQRRGCLCLFAIAIPGPLERAFISGSRAAQLVPGPWAHPVAASPSSSSSSACWSSSSAARAGCRPSGGGASPTAWWWPTSSCSRLPPRPRSFPPASPVAPSAQAVRVGLRHHRPLRHLRPDLPKPRTP